MAGQKKGRGMGGNDYGGCLLRRKEANLAQGKRSPGEDLVGKGKRRGEVSMSKPYRQVGGVPKKKKKKGYECY